MHNSDATYHGEPCKVTKAAYRACLYTGLCAADLMSVLLLIASPRSFPSPLLSVITVMVVLLFPVMTWFSAWYCLSYIRLLHERHGGRTQPE